MPAAAGAGGVALMTARELFVGVDGGGRGGRAAAAVARRTRRGRWGVRGDVDSVEFRSTLRVRMQSKVPSRVLRGAKEERERAKVSWKELGGDGRAAAGGGGGEGAGSGLRGGKGNFHEVLLDVKIKGKHDKFA